MSKIQSSNAPRTDSTHLDALIVGAGFSGIYMLYRLRKLGLKVKVFEAGDGVGGTWYWNRYPGARCDVESMEYSYSFSSDLEQEWNWSERYATQPEILRYLNTVVDRFDLRGDIRFGTRVASATYDERSEQWDIRTEQGDSVRARFCIMATGCLSAARLPEIEGIDRFAGRTYHTGRWPHEGVDLTGQRVGVIGTGSSAIQSIPNFARQASHLFVFQRTPNFSVPAQNAPLDPQYVQEFKRNYAKCREIQRNSVNGVAWRLHDQAAVDATPEERQYHYETRWREGGFGMLVAFNDLMINEASNDTAANFVRSKIMEIVRDPEIAKRLLPTDHPLGTKRICVDTEYYETFNRENVTLIDIRSTPIVEITATGVRTTQANYDLDSIVFATGFDAMTGAVLRIDVRGRSGQSLSEKWSDGPRTYLGLAIAGFPNLFTITGPGSPSVLSNMIVSIEQHVDWITSCISDLRARGMASIEATADAEEKWVAHVNEAAETTLYPRANSWYIGANVVGKPRVFMPYVGGVKAYRDKCNEVAVKGYEGFQLRRVNAGETVAAE